MEFSCNFYLFYWMASLTIILKVTRPSTAAQGYCSDHGYTPKNGRRTPLAMAGNKYFPGAVIRYSCNEYFELQPYVTTQRCEKNGTLGYVWKPDEPPKCIESVICPKPSIKHGSSDKEVYYEGDKLLVTCDSGYTLKQESVAECLETGQWSYQPTCAENYCPKPPSIENGFFNFYPNIFDDQEFPPKSFVIYSCNEGYQCEPFSQRQRECREGRWTGINPTCVREGCDPPEQSYGDYIPKRPHYDVHDTVTYVCQNDVTRTCQRDHTWSGTSCPEALTTVQMPGTSSEIYCRRPLSSDDHLNVKCCGDDAIYSDVLNDPTFCCPERGLVEFICDVGFTISGQANQWMCSTGDWVAVSSNHFETISDPPKCTRNATRGNTGGFTDDMLKPVFGTAAGVLVILSAAIIIAFCRPKLIDMKRRWRELREDEDELIIDGRRILLPSYEEAVTSQDPHQQQQACHSSSELPTTDCHDRMQGPSTSRQRTLNRNDSSSSSSTSKGLSRPSCSSDEELLVPEPANKRLDSEESSSRPGSLILKAGTSIDACVIINPPPGEQPKLNESSKEHSAPTLFPEVSHSSLTCESFSDLRAEDDPMLDLGNDTEANLESISPRTAPETSNKMQIRPVVSDAGSHLLSYPLVSDNNPSSDQQFTIHIDSNGTSINSNELPTCSDEQCCTDIPAENTDHPSMDNNIQDEDSRLALQSSDQIHIVMSSQTVANHQRVDEMGSTAV